MGWLSSLFSSQDSSMARKGQALSTTHEAFSLPGSSASLHSPLPDADHLANGLSTPDTSISPAFTYPPPKPGSYGYLPTSRGQASLLPVHNDLPPLPTSPLGPYPPLLQTWDRLREWLRREYPELGDTLNYGILPQDLAQVEMQLGFSLPEVVRESYLIVDGQEAESAAGCSEGLFFGLTLLPLDDVLDEWRQWRKVDEDPQTGANPRLKEAMQSIPPGWIRKSYSQKGWIPLVADKAGNYVGVDMDPDENGAVGQVIVFGRDFDTKVVLWQGDGLTGWAKWLSSFVDDLENGEGYELGTRVDESDDSEDELGYEGYFYDGTGRGQGDGGGDSGAGGGLRLGGEYRGWNVLEAWADRSLRKWYEAGAVPDTEMMSADEHGESEPTIEVKVEVVDLSKEAAIDQDLKPPPLAAKKSTTEKSHRPRVSIPSAGRPPAPLPVELPTADDIVDIPSPRPSRNKYDRDLESGRDGGMQEFSRQQDIALVSRHLEMSPRRNLGGKSEPSTPMSGYSEVTPTNRVQKPLPSPSTPRPVSILDLMTESGPPVDTEAMSPSPASIPKELPLVEPIAEAPTEVAETTEPVEEEVDPNTTIRLIGGGGVAGVVETEGFLEDVSGSEYDTDAASVISVTSVTNAAADAGPKKTHQKNKSSLASLKKIAKLGRKKTKKSNADNAGTATSQK